MAEFICVQVACESVSQAQMIAETLVAEQLAACVQLTEVASVYRWQGEIERAAECALQIKTRASLFEQISARVTELHSYEVPEIIGLPILSISESYATWLDQNCVK